MLKVSFLTLLLMSSSVFAQQSSNKDRKAEPKAYISAELETASDAEVKTKMEELGRKLKKENAAAGYIINYGSPEEVSRREIQIRDSLNRRCDYDCQRLVLVNGGESEKLKSVFWIVPEGAKPPTP